MGRPRVYDDPEQIKLRAEASVKAKLRAKARSLGMTLTQFMMTAALAFDPSAVMAKEVPSENYSVYAMPTQSEPEEAGMSAVLESANTSTDEESSSSATDASAPADRPAASPLSNDRAASLPGGVASHPSEPKPSSLAVGEPLSEAIPAPPIQHGDRLSAAQWQRIHVARAAIFAGFPSSELTEADRGPKESPNADVDAWPDYYEVCLSRLRREYGIEASPSKPIVAAAPAPVAPDLTPETDPIIIELLRRDRELAEIDRTTRSIYIANDRREISLQIHRRRMAEASAKLRAFDPDPEKPPTEKEIKAVAAELKPKNRNDHPWRKVLPPKRPK
jgi:hypothetical protein